MRVVVLSDTHGQLRSEVFAHLEGADLIIHAGDVGDQDVLSGLERYAPVLAVRGNVDRGPWATDLPRTRVVELGDHLVYVLHILEDLDLDPGAAGFSAVIYGHSHRPETEVRAGVLYLNPGSCGPRRFSLPITLAELEVSRSGLNPSIVELGSDDPGVGH